MPMHNSNDIPAGLLAALTNIDWQLQGWLAEHHALTEAQIATALFASPARARRRLDTLTAAGLVERFQDLVTENMADEDINPWFYTTGPHGYWQPRYADGFLDRMWALGGGPQLNELTEVNGFFTSLAGHARTNAGAHLRRWWSAAHTAEVYPQAFMTAEQRATQGRACPDGHGIWQAEGHIIGLFLHHATSLPSPQEIALARRAYQTVTDVGAASFAVLYRLPDPATEARFHDLIAADPPTVTLATTTATGNPAEPIWHITERRMPATASTSSPTRHAPRKADRPATRPSAQAGHQMIWQ